MIRLLHLSDLHFGQHSRLKDKDPADAGKSFHRALVQAEPGLDKAAGNPGVDLVVVTGDLAEVGKPKEFRQVGAFLRALAGEFGIEHRRFVFCPGNHDISRPLCRKVEADQEIEDFDDDELRRRIDGVKLRFYDEFLAEFYDTKADAPLDGTAQPLGHGAFVHGFPGFRLSIAALNSCEKESHREGDHVGRVSEAQARALMTHWRQGEVTRWLKIVAVHHNPTPTVDANVASWREWLVGKELHRDQIAAWEGDVRGFEGGERLKGIVEDCQVQVVLHGHHHAKDRHVWPWRGSGYGHVLSAGSLTLVDEKLPGTEPASFQLLALDPEAATLEAKSFVWVDWARALGEVEQGTFRPDPATTYSQRLDLPEGFVVASRSEPAEPEDRTELAGFVRTLRTAFRGAYSRWDLATAGVTQAGGVGRPIDVGLDAMYVEMRLGRGYDPSKLDRGEPIVPEALLERRWPLAIRGAAGSGKTTWMRWTFRRLLDVERAVPLMLVLRDLARVWGDARPGGERSLEASLDFWAAEQIGSGWKSGFVKKLLEAVDGPIPVLLVDGWDELGPLGEAVRVKLVGLMRLYPRLRVAVSSRPYGEGVPSHSEGFEVLDLQPLSGTRGGNPGSWGEIGQLTAGFFEKCLQDKRKEHRALTESFLEALARSADAQSLARTPLLLTMMLLISRSRPLPDKRHDLYEACIDNLLTARIQRKEREGAQLSLEQWRPDDGDIRKRAAAKLAHGLLSKGTAKESPVRRAHTMSRAQAVRLLPKGWPEEHRKGFVAWLAGPAGLLVDRADGSLAFVHLSFQEYLSACFLDSRREGLEPRLIAFRQHLEKVAWRETLLLWAAKIDKRNPERIDELVAELSDEDQGLQLVGFLFADGLGSDWAFERWAERYLRRLQTIHIVGWQELARAWRACQQNSRRDTLETIIGRVATKASWPGWTRLSLFGEHACDLLSLSLSRNPTARSLVQSIEGELTPSRLASGRLLCGGLVLWPLGSDVRTFNIWPNERRLRGIQLQGLIACGGGLGNLSRASSDLLRADMVRTPLVSLSWSSVFSLASGFAQDFGRHFTPDLARDFAHGLAREVARALARPPANGVAPPLGRVLTSDFARILACDFSHSYSRTFACEFTRGFSQDPARGVPLELIDRLTQRFADRWKLDVKENPWLFDFARLELISYGRVAGFALLKYRPSGRPDPILTLFAAACRLTDASPNSDASELEEALENYGPKLHPVWPALARHLARRSDAADQELLEGLARDPNQVEDGPLRWGLRFIVRGDVMLDDGSFVTLDELCDRVGLPHLPYLEDPPTPLEVDWAGEGDG